MKAGRDEAMRLMAASGLMALTFLGLACDPESETASSSPTATATSALASLVSAPEASATLPPAPTLEPTPVAPTTYIVQSGDYPSLIAENVGVPAALQDDWIVAMLALNETDATALQVGQELKLPPFSPGASAGGQATIAPTTTSADVPLPTATSAAEAPARTAVVEVPATDTPAPADTPIPVEPTATTAPIPTAPPVSDGPVWYVSSHFSAEFYYCDADSGWQGLSPTYLEVYDSEPALQQAYGGTRTKHPDSVC